MTSFTGIKFNNRKNKYSGCMIDTSLISDMTVIDCHEMSFFSFLLSSFFKLPKKEGELATGSLQPEVFVFNS